jgi:GntR family transcriptional regulator, carbon starvation induced regulator
VSAAEPRSRSEWAEDRLRRAIISGELPPGERVLVERLAQTWNVSATPLREGLRVLAGEGLIVLDAQRGARVAEISMAEMIEVYELRLMIEPYAFRLSIESREPAWQTQVAEAWHRLRAIQSQRAATPLELEPAHTEFHLALVSGCGSASLLRLASVLSTQALRFRTLVAPRRPGGNRRSLAEHRRLSELAVDGDPGEAAQFLATHLSWPLATAVDEDAIERVSARLARLDSGLLVAGLAAFGAGPAP